jgi:PilZ domain
VKDRRKFLRFPVKLSARYSEEKKEDWSRQCSIVDISREGMGLVVHLIEKPPIGSLLHFMVDVPTKEKPVCFTGVLSWIKALKEDPDYNFKGGVQLEVIDSEDRWILLDYAYEAWKEIQEGDSGREESAE